MLVIIEFQTVYLFYFSKWTKAVLQQVVLELLILYSLRRESGHKLQAVTEILDIVHRLRPENPQRFGGRIFLRVQVERERGEPAVVGPLEGVFLSPYSSVILPLT